jgi:hypothetical protein
MPEPKSTLVVDVALERHRHVSRRIGMATRECVERGKEPACLASARLVSRTLEPLVDAKPSDPDVLQRLAIGTGRIHMSPAPESEEGTRLIVECDQGAVPDRGGLVPDPLPDP